MKISPTRVCSIALVCQKLLSGIRRAGTSKSLTVKSLILLGVLFLGMFCWLPVARMQTVADKANKATKTDKRSSSVKAKQTAANSILARQNTNSPAKSASLNLIPELNSLQSPILASADFELLGLGVTASPAAQTVPKNIPTIIQIELAGALNLPGNYRVRGELAGPSFTSPVQLEAIIGEPLQIPGLPNTGDHTVRNLRVVEVNNGAESTVGQVTPDLCSITVIDGILVTEVQVNELTYDQIVQAGINLGDSYQYFNFVLGLGTTSNGQQISIPVAFPPVGGGPQIPVVGQPTLSNPNVSVPDILPVMLEVEGGEGEGEGAPLGGGDGGGQIQIPGVIVFPGRIGLLNQFFEAIVLVSNNSPNGTPLVVRNLKAKAVLPDNGTPDNTTDDPLRIAQTQTGGAISELDIHGLGPDGRYGTADDLLLFGPGQSGQATFLLEGLKEGLHTINFKLEGMLDGLPIGPVRIRGQAPGAVLVRDRRFGVTFTHPSVVRAGQEYELGMTVYNSGNANINGFFAELARNSISGATLLGTETRRTITATVQPGNTASIKWRLRSNTTGAVTASYVKVGEGISSGLNLVTGVGDRNVPLSPDSLILPDSTSFLPVDIVERAREVLGQGWSVANAPPGSLPSGVAPISKQVVVDRAVELGTAGLRIQFGENINVSLVTLLRDWLGEQRPSGGFADALRNTTSGFRFYDAVGSHFNQTINPLHEIFAQNLVKAESGRSPFAAALITQASGQPIFAARLVSNNNRKVGFGAGAGERWGELPNAFGLQFNAFNAEGETLNTQGQLLLASNPASGDWTVEIDAKASGAADISLLLPLNRAYRRVTFGQLNLVQGKRYRIVFRPQNQTAFVIQELQNNSYVDLPFAPAISQIAEPSPELVGVIQTTPQILSGGDSYGRLVGLLFSKPMNKENVENANRYLVTGGDVNNTNPPEQLGGTIGVSNARASLGDRFVFLALKEPVGPFINREVTISSAVDKHGLALSNIVKPISMRVSPEANPPGTWITGTAINADGTPVVNAAINYAVPPCGPGDPIIIASKKTDGDGNYRFEYVRNSDVCSGGYFLIVGHPQTLSVKNLGTPINYHGQHTVLNAVFLARGNVTGTIYKNNGAPAERAVVRVTPFLEPAASQVVIADVQGRYQVQDIPVGNVSVKAFHSNLAGDERTTGLAAGVIAGPNETAIVNINLQNVSGVINGRVVNANQTVAARTLIVARAAIPGFGSGPVGYAFSNVDGTFKLSNLPIGQISLSANSVLNQISQAQTVQLTAATPIVNNVLVVLNGNGSVSGRVLNDAGAPVANARVSGGSSVVRTDASGNYSIQGIQEGQISINATDPITKQSGSTTVNVQAGQETANAVIYIYRPATVTGQVFKKQNGATVPAANIIVTSDGINRATTNSTGNYTLNNVQSRGEILLRFVDVSRKLAINLGTVVAPGETLIRNATFDPTRIHGRITQPDGVTPTLAQVKVNVPVVDLTAGPFFGTFRNDLPFYLQTGADGKYALETLNPGDYSVSTSNAFFPITVRQGGRLAPGADLECNLSLVDSLAGKIKGTVYQPDGTTLVGAGVRVTLGSGTLGDATVPTDENGYFEFAEVFSAGGYPLTATDPVTGFTNRISISVKKNEDSVSAIRLKGRGTLRVKVIDAAGQPATSGSVTLDGAEYPNDHRYQDITLNNTGIFEFDNLFEGNYAISAEQLGLGGRVQATVVRNAGVEAIIQLAPSGAVSGRVFMPNGTTAVGLADVTLKSNGQILGILTTSDAEEDRGAFAFTNVPIGEFTVEAFDNRTGRTGVSNGRLAEQGQTAQVTINLTAVGAVAGIVTANGNPVDHALVKIQATGSGSRTISLEATTDSAGRYRFAGIPAGRFTVTAEDVSSSLSGIVSGVIVGTNEPLPDTIVNVALASTGTVTGKIYQNGGAQPFTGAAIILSMGNRVLATTSDESGNYRFSYVPLGAFRIRAQAPTGFERGQIADLNLTTPGEILTADVTMEGLGNVTGQALDSDGTVLNRGNVVFTNNAWGTPLTFTTAVQSNGTYNISNVPTGNFNLRLTLPNRVGVGTASGALSSNQTLQLPLQLEAAGKIIGKVISPDGTTPASGADVTLRLNRQNAGSFTFYTHTDAQGLWSIENIPLGAAAIEFFDLSSGGQARRSNLLLSANGQVIDTGDVVLSNQASSAIAGVVTNPSGQPVSGAQLTLQASNGTFSAITNSAGRFSFETVESGNFRIQALDSVSGLRAIAVGTVPTAPQTLTVNIRLQAGGSVNGTIFRNGGTQLVAGVPVVIRSANQNGILAETTSDAQGGYSFDIVPIGNFTVEAQDPATGDLGRASNQINSNGEVRTVNVIFNGVGRVNVTVRNASGNAVGGAQVKLTNQAFSVEQTLTTQSDGTAIFERVLAGSFFVRATEQTSGLKGSVSGNLSVNGVANVVITLQPTGTIGGKVFEPNGTTPLSGATVRLFTDNGEVRRVTTDVNGIYLIDAIPLRNYSLEALDSGNRRRALIPSLNVFNTVQIERNLTFIGLGTVTGQVRNPNGSGASFLPVTIQSEFSLPNNLTAQTDTTGHYTIANVPAARFVASSSNSNQTLSGATSGQLTQDGETLTINVQLLDSTITLPRDLFDANNFRFDVQTGGNLRYGTANLYHGSALSWLYLTNADGSGGQYFGGGGAATAEDNNREFAVRQNGLLGLDVTRKIFVSENGYFARYLEIFSNPGTTPIDINAAIYSGFNYTPQIVSTSSGDTEFSIDDLWVVSDDDDGSNSYPASAPTLTQLIGGANANLTIYSVRNPGYYQWRNVVVPAGQTVIIMHFVAQQSNHASAIATAERLVQIPPEALSGLSLDEISKVKNFVLPADGVSTLQPLAVPSRQGAVNGRVFVSDGQTPLGNTNVYLRGKNLFFGKSLTMLTNSQGQFNFTGAVVDDFTLQALHPVTNLLSPIFDGGFVSNQTAVTKDVIFSNSGEIEGVVTRPNGASVNGGYVQIYRSSPFFNKIINLPSNGFYSLSGISAGNYEVTATLAHPQGTQLSTKVNVTINNGQKTIANIAFETGTINGRVFDSNNQAMNNVGVRISQTNQYFSRQTYTNSAGQYNLTDVPVGAYTVTATNPLNGSDTTATINVAANQTVTQDITLSSTATVQLQVTKLAGGPAANAQVRIFEGPNLSQRNASYVTDANGQLIITNVIPGNIKVRVISPGSVYAHRDFDATVAAGQTLPVTMTLAAMATVRVTITNGNNAPYIGSNVYLKNQFDEFRYIGQTDANGRINASNVPEGEFIIRVDNPSRSTFKGVISLADDGEIVDAAIIVRTIRIQGLTLAGDGETPVKDAYVEIFDANTSFRLATDYSNHNGAFDVPVTTGSVNIYITARFPYNSSLVEEKTITVTNPGQPVIVNITLPIPVIKGTVTFGDGTPVANAQVYATRSPYNYQNIISNDSQGNYAIVVGGAGEYVLTAQHSDSGLTKTETINVTETTLPTIKNIVLPPSGTISGVVSSSNGTPKTSIQVTLYTADQNFQRYATTDSQGRYTFRGVLMGSFVVKADDYQTSISATGTGTIVNESETVQTNIVFPPTSNITGTVYASDGTTPIADAPVTVHSFDQFGVAYTADAISNSNGQFSFNSVPVGRVRVAANRPVDDLTEAGVFEGNLNANETLVSNINFGNAFNSYDYDHPYFVWTGEFWHQTKHDGSTTSWDEVGAYDDGSYSLEVNDNYFSPITNIGLLKQDNREIAVGPAFSDNGLRIDRKVYAPNPGGFVRYIESISNQMPFPQEVTVQINIRRRTYNPRIVQSPAETNNLYAVTDDSGDCCSKALGFVFGGAGARTGLDSTSDELVNPQYYERYYGCYRWKVMIPAGQTIALMHFALQREPTDAAGAQAASVALSNLTLPDALTGLSDEELSQIVNFNIPPNLQNRLAMQFKKQNKPNIPGKSPIAAVKTNIKERIRKYENAPAEKTSVR